MVRLCLAAIALFLTIGVADAQNCANGQCSMISSRGFVLQQSPRQVANYTRTVASASQTTKTMTVSESHDALDEVNAARAKRGLRPYLRDNGLTLGALNVSKFRAERRIKGHTANDFGGLPVGTSAKAAGCAALEPFWGFGACAMYENWSHAGAAKTLGSDGQFYCQLFVR